MRDLNDIEMDLSSRFESEFSRLRTQNERLSVEVRALTQKVERLERELKAVQDALSRKASREEAMLFAQQEASFWHH